MTASDVDMDPLTRGLSLVRDTWRTKTEIEIDLDSLFLVMVFSKLSMEYFVTYSSLNIVLH